MMNDVQLMEQGIMQISQILGFIFGIITTIYILFSIPSRLNKILDKLDKIDTVAHNQVLIEDKIDSLIKEKEKDE